MSKLPDPKKIALGKSEHAQQVALFSWASHPDVRAEFPEIDMMFAVPNGGERNHKVAAQMVAEGTRAGVLDVCLPVPRNNWHGFFFEMKYGKNKPSTEQITFANRLIALGWYVGCYWSYEAAKKAVITYLKGEI